MWLSYDPGLGLFAQCTAVVVRLGLHHEFEGRAVEQVVVADEVFMPTLVVDLHFRDEYIQRLIVVFKITCLDADIIAILQMDAGILKQRCSECVFV